LRKSANNAVENDREEYGCIFHGVSALALALITPEQPIHRKGNAVSKIYLVEGPVGSGKSTFAERLALQINAPHIDLDSWMVNLFRPDRPSSGVIEWYVARKERCIEQIWDVAKRVLDANCDVILELGLIQRSSRKAMYTRADESGHELIVYVLDASRDVRRERVRQRNLEKGSTFSMEVTDEVFEMASDMWAEPDDVECSEQNIEFVATPPANGALH
jgi:predicted kinase